MYKNWLSTKSCITIKLLHSNSASVFVVVVIIAVTLVDIVVLVTVIIVITLEPSQFPGTPKKISAI